MQSEGINIRLLAKLKWRDTVGMQEEEVIIINHERVFELGMIMKDVYLHVLLKLHSPHTDRRENSFCHFTQKLNF